MAGSVLVRLGLSQLAVARAVHWYPAPSLDTKHQSVGLPAAEKVASRSSGLVRASDQLVAPAETAELDLETGAPAAEVHFAIHFARQQGSSACGCRPTT